MRRQKIYTPAVGDVLATYTLGYVKVITKFDDRVLCRQVEGDEEIPLSLAAARQRNCKLENLERKVK